MTIQKGYTKRPLLPRILALCAVLIVFGGLGYYLSEPFYGQETPLQEIVVQPLRGIDK